MSVPPRPSRRQRQAEATRQDIIAAARRLIAERGYAATSVAHIDEEGGVREMIPVIMAETDPRRLVGHQVHLTRLLNERCDDLLHVLRATAPLEPDVAAVLTEGYGRHQSGAKHVVTRLDVLGAL